jgi:hypothetical protein
MAIVIEDPAHPFKMKLMMPGQQEAAQAIAAALTKAEAAAA